MTQVRFAYPTEFLRETIARVLDTAARLGATAAEAEISEAFGQTVTVRRGEVETIEYNRDKGVGVTVYVGQQRGHASTTDFSERALQDTVAAALSIARRTAADPYAGLADPALFAQDPPDLALYWPWEVSVEGAIELARTCEAAAFAVDPRIQNSEGASVSTQESHFVYGNSAGFVGHYPASRHSVSCAVIAGEGDSMQRDYWYAVARAPEDVEPAEGVGRRAGQRAVTRLGARKVATQEVPVLFEAPLASGLIGNFVQAVSGGSLYRKSSFLLDSLGQEVFAPWVQIDERPHLKRGLASSPFDSEGVATRDRPVVAGGVVQGYFLGSYSARKLGMTSTGNAGGNHNLTVRSGPDDFDALLRRMGRGLVVTELLGQGVNPVTGDYSRGAAGFWVENGEIVHPVEEITIAGNLKAMFKGMVAVGNDVLVRGSRQCGSILLDRMTVAGD